MLVTQKNKIRDLTKQEYKTISLMCHYSKNLYNFGLYNIRQYFFNNGKYIPYEQNYYLVKGNENYKLLLAQSSQQTLKVVDRSFRSFFGLLKKKRKGQYNKDVRIPRYLKNDGKFLVIFPKQLVRMTKECFVFSLSRAFQIAHKMSIKEIRIKKPTFITKQNIHEIRILPKPNHFEIEYVYDKKVEKQELVPDTYLSIDLGVSNLATCVNCQSGRSFILDGRKLKSFNRWYNKTQAKLQSIKDVQGLKGRTNRQKRLDEKRRWYINNYMNQAVNIIVKYCVKEKISTILIGEIKEWKQDIELGKRNNQNFVQIPFNLLKRKLESKCEQFRMIYILVNESYTSKCSFLDREEVKKQSEYKGKRVYRGLFKSSEDILVNADVNGAINLFTKYKGIQNVKYDGLASGVRSAPIRLCV